MSQPDYSSPNPYQPPQVEFPVFAPQASANLRLFKVLKDFRTQIVALGVVWILLSGLVLVIGTVLGSTLGSDTSAGPLVLAILGASGLIWGGLGVCTCLKQMWAVYTGLVLSYLSVAGNLINLNLCAIVILAIIIVQAHRVIGFANELARAGIPLSTRPQDLQVKLQLPG